MSSRTVSGVATVAKASCINDVDRSDFVGSVVAYASSVEVDGHAWSERPLMLHDDTARLGLVLGWMPCGVEADDSNDVGLHERAARTRGMAAGCK